MEARVKQDDFQKLLAAAEVAATPQHYILDAEGNVVPEFDLHVWAAWMERKDRKLASDTIETPKGPRLVSTVFLGLDHRFGGGGAPVIFETMTFRPMTGQEIKARDRLFKSDTGWEWTEDDEFPMERYCSLQEALKGHDEAVAKLRAIK